MRARKISDFFDRKFVPFLNHIKPYLFSLRKNAVESVKNATPKILVRSNPKKQIPDNRVFQLFRTAAPVESAENATSKSQQVPFLTKQNATAKRFPSLSTVSKHFLKIVFLLVAKSRKHVSDIQRQKLPKET